MTSPQGGVDALAQNEPLGRGVNIIGYDPLWRCRSEARVLDSHFRLVKDAGFSWWASICPLQVHGTGA